MDGRGVKGVGGRYVGDRGMIMSVGMILTLRLSIGGRGSDSCKVSGNVSGIVSGKVTVCISISISISVGVSVNVNVSISVSTIIFDNVPLKIAIHFRSEI